MNLRPHFLSREQGLLSKFFPSQTREESKSPQDCAQSLPRHSSQHKRCNLFASPAFRHLNRPAAITAWQGPVLLLLILLPINEHGSSVQFSRSVVSDSLDPMDCSQAPLSIGFSRQEYWSGLPFPSPNYCFSSVQFSCSVVSNSLRPHEL